MRRMLRKLIRWAIDADRANTPQPEYYSGVNWEAAASEFIRIYTIKNGFLVQTQNSSTAHHIGGGGGKTSNQSNMLYFKTPQELTEYIMQNETIKRLNP